MNSVLKLGNAVRPRQNRTKPDQRITVTDRLVIIDEKGERKFYHSYQPQVIKLLNFLIN
jgi:hypothetical protein